MWKKCIHDNFLCKDANLFITISFLWKFLLFSFYYYDYFSLILCSKTTLVPPKSWQYRWERAALSEHTVSQVRRRYDVLLWGARLLFISHHLLHPSHQAQSGRAKKMIDHLGTRGGRSAGWWGIIIKACGSGVPQRRDYGTIPYRYIHFILN